MYAAYGVTSVMSIGSDTYDEVGSIEKGNWADLLVLNANPLTDIANARQIDSVYIAGRKSTWRRRRRTDLV
jgi:imidazolonepropionase-like amidohydrolase